MLSFSIICIEFWPDFSYYFKRKQEIYFKLAKENKDVSCLFHLFGQLCHEANLVIRTGRVEHEEFAVKAALIEHRAAGKLRRVVSPEHAAIEAYYLVDARGQIAELERRKALDYLVGVGVQAAVGVGAQLVAFVRHPFAGRCMLVQISSTFTSLYIITVVGVGHYLRQIGCSGCG
mgnify:CR=1 FL=1